MHKRHEQQNNMDKPNDTVFPKTVSQIYMIYSAYIIPAIFKELVHKKGFGRDVMLELKC